MRLCLHGYTYSERAQRVGVRRSYYNIQQSLVLVMRVTRARVRIIDKLCAAFSHRYTRTLIYAGVRLLLLLRVHVRASDSCAAL